MCSVRARSRHHGERAAFQKVQGRASPSCPHMCPGPGLLQASSSWAQHSHMPAPAPPSSGPAAVSPGPSRPPQSLPGPPHPLHPLRAAACPAKAAQVLPPFRFLSRAEGRASARGLPASFCTCSLHPACPLLAPEVAAPREALSAPSQPPGLPGLVLLSGSLHLHAHSGGAGSRRPAWVSACPPLMCCSPSSRGA